ncbi:FtsX-like permease family protein [Arcanobacterium ihumii]|uniref:FtsX-like permease family protein n=1 Tax=Arcanobacterium ihumii TaxID=2138162 RepID=UPI000F52904E|nr:FtsX-like permease family protein [Arcanobacterium ihumii]
MNTLSIALSLSRARLKSSKNAGFLDAMMLLAFTVSSWLTITTFAGVWMFIQRQDTVGVDLSLIYDVDPEVFEGIGAIYVGLSVLALSLLIFPLLSLGIAATQLGANGRSHRLASIRLIGMTAGQVTLMTIFETLVLSTIGYFLGVILYFISIPFWQKLSFQSLRVLPTEMMLPWWGFVGIFFLISVLAMLASIFGLRKVSISPLGVAKREAAASVKIWRVVILVIGFGVIVFATSRFSPLDASTTQYLSMAIVILAFFGGTSLAGPFFIQTLARPLTRTGRTAQLIAARRIIDNPKTTWRNVAAVSLMALMVSFVVFNVSFSFEGRPNKTREQQIQLLTQQVMLEDIIQGTIIAFGIALIISCISTLIHQASDVIDRKDETQALVHLGMPLGTLTKARLIQVIAPMLLMLVIATGLGISPGLLNGVRPPAHNIALMSALLGIGLLASILSVVFTAPIQNALVKTHHRRND